MFSFLMTQSARARRDAKNWLEVADKVFHYRRDELPEADLHALNLRREELRARIQGKADAAQIKLGIEALEQALHRTGGRVYPKGAMADNVEFFLAASIIILGIRAFFVQPFKIPTNSMWPTYFGMKHEVFADPAQAPGAVAQIFRLAAFGATRREVVAPAAGELRIPFLPGESRITVPAGLVPGRKWLVVPTTVKEYTVFIGEEPVRFRVPADFDFDTLAMEAFFGDQYRGAETMQALQKAGKLGEKFYTIQDRGTRKNLRTALLSTGKTVRSGQIALSFDVLTGDQLFVDRFTYNFFKPEVGQGFVFRTGNIKGIGQDQYYIKRLVGTPGDALEIRGSTLYRNGSPITGAESFDLNGNRTGLYRGYQASGLLAPGQTVTVKEDEFFALGDNSYNSQDGRVWGFVPAKDAIGRPLFIYYPFTKRWGPAR